jgi:hypothetical protein
MAKKPKGTGSKTGKTAKKEVKKIEKGQEGPDWSGITKNPHNLTPEQKRIIDSW